MNAMQAEKIQVLCSFYRDEYDCLLCESKNTIVVNGKIKSDDSSVYSRMDNDCEVINNKLNGQLKILLFNVNRRDYTIHSRPAQPELGWKELEDDVFQISPEKLERIKAIKESIHLRNKFYEDLGSVSEDTLTPILSPIFSGGLPWPSGRPQYKIIHTQKSTILISHGLSNCFEKEREDKEIQYNGFAIELYFEFEGHMEMERFHNHYSIGILKQLTQNAINHGNFNGLFREKGPVSIQFSDGNFSKQYQDSEGNYAILMNASSENVPSEMKLNKEGVLLVACKLLTLEDFLICSNDKTGKLRKELNNKYAENKGFCYSPFEMK